MTRAALLHLLDSPASLSAAAVQDLEQLAQAFPYCQTAHLLLAKAAHDHGSMLAGQRLRRAATYATDRQLLRQLLAQQLPVVVNLVVANTNADADSNISSGNVSNGSSSGSATVPAAIAEDATPAAELLALAGGVGEEAAAQPEEEGSPSVEPAAPEAEPTENKLALTETPPARIAAEGQRPEPEAEAEPAPAPLVLAEAAPVPAGDAAEPSAELITIAPAAPAEAADLTSVSSAEEAAPAEGASDEANNEADADSLPPIRPPVEVGTARFEFGLSSPALEAEFTAYQLPELLADELAAKPAPAAAGPGAFRGGAELAYALAAGSRLGYALQADFAGDAAEAALPAVPGAHPPGSVLPAAGEFFAPDALLLEHLARQPAPALAAPSPLDLIDSFLRRAPQRRRGIVTLLTVAEQADLSMRSTRAEPDLASESLARILAGQGKTERAIAVYERLMVRQPEKSAYFAVQIELLRNPPTPSS